MAAYDVELLIAASRLVARSAGQRGRLPSATVRRSISTAYYAMFHFLLDEVGRRLVGTSNDLRVRRRALGRTITHKGAKTALGKVRGAAVDVSIADFLRPPAHAGGSVAPPDFLRSFASVFIDAQSKRHDADYDLNTPLSEDDARLLIRRVRRAIDGWRSASQPVDRDLKAAMCSLILLKGQLRADD